MLVDDGVAGDTALKGGAAVNLTGLAVDTVAADGAVDVAGAHCCYERGPKGTLCGDGWVGGGSGKERSLGLVTELVGEVCLSAQGG